MSDDITNAGAGTPAADTVGDQPTAQPAGEAQFHALAVAADPALAAQATLGGGGDDVWAAEKASYDGHVALALDTTPLPDLDGVLDLLTVAHDLFDVPAMDFGGDASGDGAAS